MKTPKVKTLAGLLVLTPALALPAFGQATGRADIAPVDDDIVELPTFEVVTEKDTGYLAVDALAGGRTAMPLKFTPASMDAITREFMDDFAITNVEEALQWATNVIAAPGIETSNTPFNSWDYNFRGAGVSLQGGRGTKRNYNTYFQVADGYNTQRFEIGLGPNSILYGIGGPGGNVSIYTKVPRLDRNFGTIDSSINNFGYYRIAVDYNHKLNDEFAVRVNAVRASGEGYRDWDKNKKNAATLALLWKPAQHTQLRLEVEAAQSKGHVIRSAMNEQSSGWDGSSIADTANTVLDPMPPGLSLQSNQEQYWVYTANAPDAGVLNNINAYKSTGIGLKMAPYRGFYTGPIFHRNTNNRYNPANPDFAGPLEPDFIPLLPGKKFTWGSGTFESRFQTLTFWFDHQFSPTLDMQVILYRYNDAQDSHDANNMAGGWSYDVNKQLADGSPNPNFGKLYGDMQMNRQLQQRQASEARIQFNYRMYGSLFGSPLKQRFSFGASIEEWGYHASSKGAGIVGLDPALPLAVRRVYGRQYIDNPHIPMEIPAESNGRQFGYFLSGWYDFDQTHKISNAVLASHTLLFDDQLSILLGVRYDDYSYENVPKPGSTSVPVSTTAHKVTYTGGAVYYIAGRWLGLVANYSVNSDPIKINANPGLYATSLPTAQGKSTDIGIRISTGDGRYYANFNRYFGRQINRQMQAGLINFGAIWADYYNAIPTTPDETFTTLRYTDVQSLKLEGYEASFVAQPIKGLTMRVSFAYPEVAELTESMSDSRRYFYEHLEEWADAVQSSQTHGDPSVYNAGVNLSTKLGNAVNTLANNMAGMEQTQHVKYTLSGNIRYNFSRGFLKGFAMGMGVSYQAKKYIQSIQDEAGALEKYYTDDVLNGSFFASYATRILGYPASIQLNINNIFNRNDAFINGYDANWRYEDGSAVPNNYTIPAPINGQISLRIRF